MSSYDAKVIVVEYIKTHRMFYFLPIDKIGMVVGFSYTFFVSLLSLKIGAYQFLLMYLCAFIGGYSLFGFRPAYRRAKFMENAKKICIAGDLITVSRESGDEIISYKGREIRLFNRGKGVSDVVVGGLFKSLAMTVGTNLKFEVTLCGVINSEEVMQYMRKHV